MTDFYYYMVHEVVKERKKGRKNFKPQESQMKYRQKKNPHVLILSLVLCTSLTLLGTPLHLLVYVVISVLPSM